MSARRTAAVRAAEAPASLFGAALDCPADREAERLRPAPGAPVAVLPRWPFGDLPARHYGVILADPPWRFEQYSALGEEKAPQAHYPCMDIDAIKDLPVGALAAPNCLILLWATAPMLPEALAVLAAWGFAFKTAGAWAKRTSADGGWQMGTGYLLRSAIEPFLIGTIGSPAIADFGIRNLIVAPVREHSRKPDEAHAALERLRGDVPRLELFARQRRPGWDAWGNETDKFGNSAGGPGGVAAAGERAGDWP